MKNSVDVITLLNVYEKIKSNGECSETECKLEGISCSASHDGYALYLSDPQVSLEINFHNTYHFHTRHEDPEGIINQTSTEFHANNEAQIEQFVNKLMELDKRY